MASPPDESAEVVDDTVHATSYLILMLFPQLSYKQHLATEHVSNMERVQAFPYGFNAFRRRPRVHMYTNVLQIKYFGTLSSND